MQDTVCCGCSVVCDDVAVELTKSGFQSVGLCKLGHEYCNSFTNRSRLKAPLIKSKTGKQKRVALSSALDSAAKRLQESTKPLLLGWSNSPNETIQQGLALSRKVKGVFDSTASYEYGQLLEHKLHGGDQHQQLLDLVRNQADHIIYWGVNPAESHHRHASRYTVFPKGEKIPEGRESRIVSVIDIRDTESMRLANHQLILTPETGDVSFLQALIAELEGTASTPPASVGGAPAIGFLSFAKQLRSSEFIALFYGNGLLHSTHGSQSLPLLTKTVSLLNQNGRKCVTLPMVAYCNTIGAVKTSLKAAKAPFSVDFTSSKPSVAPLPLKELAQGRFDAALIVGWDALSLLPGPAARALRSLPIISLSTHPTLTTREAHIVFPTALTGVEAGGHVHRMDGTQVHLKPFTQPPSGISTEQTVLEELIQRL
jgi:formylmethanofuran dehydrogenase subunit B